MKSSTNISMISTGLSGMVGCRDVGIVTTSNLCQGSVVFSFTISDILSLAISYPAHKKVGDLYHPICNDFGATSSISSRDTGQPSGAGST